MITFTQLSERFSDRLFHLTPINRLVDILRDGVIKTSSVSDEAYDLKDKNLAADGRGKENFISFARSLGTDYTMYVSERGIATAIEVDGRKMGQRYRGTAINTMRVMKPADMNNPTKTSKRAKGYNEEEDRLWTDDEYVTLRELGVKRILLKTPDNSVAFKFHSGNIEFDYKKIKELDQERGIPVEMVRKI